MGVELISCTPVFLTMFIRHMVLLALAARDHSSLKLLSERYGQECSYQGSTAPQSHDPCDACIIRLSPRFLQNLEYETADRARNNLWKRDEDIMNPEDNARLSCLSTTVLPRFKRRFLWLRSSLSPVFVKDWLALSLPFLSGEPRNIRGD